MTRGQRVRVNLGETWPDCVCWPHGLSGTVLETVGRCAIVRIDGYDYSTTLEQKDLEVITSKDPQPCANS